MFRLYVCVYQTEVSGLSSGFSYSKTGVQTIYIQVNIISLFIFAYKSITYFYDLQFVFSISFCNIFRSFRFVKSNYKTASYLFLGKTNLMKLEWIIEVGNIIGTVRVTLIFIDVEPCDSFIVFSPSNESSSLIFTCVFFLKVKLHLHQNTLSNFI